MQGDWRLTSLGLPPLSSATLVATPTAAIRRGLGATTITEMENEKDDMGVLFCHPFETLWTLKCQWERRIRHVTGSVWDIFNLLYAWNPLASTLLSSITFNHQIFSDLAAKRLSANNWHFSPSTFCRGCLQAVGECIGAHLVRFWLSIELHFKTLPHPTPFEHNYWIISESWTLPATQPSRPPG